MAISITRALSELKTLKKRITKHTQQSIFITTVTSNKNPLSATEEDMKANWASVNDLITRYENVKFAIVRSNARTNVKIGAKIYTVAEAITMKECFEHGKSLLNTIRNQRMTVNNTVEAHRRSVQEKLDSLLETNFKKDRKTSDDEIKTISEAYLKSNEIKVIDPLKLDTRIAELEKHIDDFLGNVDFALSESNAITTIEI